MTDRYNVPNGVGYPQRTPRLGLPGLGSPMGNSGQIVMPPDRRLLQWGNKVIKGGRIVNLAVAQTIELPLISDSGSFIMFNDGSTGDANIRIRLTNAEGQKSDLFTVRRGFAIDGMPFTKVDAVWAAQADTTLEYIYAQTYKNDTIQFE